MKKKSVLILTLLVALCALPFTAQAVCTQAIPTQFKSMLFGGAFQKSHTYKIAFYQAAAAWDATTTAYAATNEITGSAYNAGGYTLEGFAVATSGTTAYIDFTDDVTASVTFNQASSCAIIYDDTLANATCAGVDDPWDCCSGSGAGTCTDAVVYVATFTPVQPSAGTLTITFPTADASNAIVRIAKSAWSWLFPEAYADDLGWRVDPEQGFISVRDALVNIKGVQAEALPGQ